MEWLSELEEGDSVFVCILTNKNHVLRLKGTVVQVTDRVSVTAWLDEPRPLYFSISPLSAGKQIDGDEGFWIEQDNCE